MNNLLWIVCDDAPEKNPRIQSLLRRLDVPHEYYISESRVSPSSDICTY